PFPGSLTAYDMEMQVGDFLAAIDAGIGHEAEPPFRARTTAVVGCQARSQGNHSTQPAGVVGADVLQGYDVAPRDEQQVHGGGGVDVVEGHELVVFVDLLGRDLAAGDFAEDTVVAHRIPCSG